MPNKLSWEKEKHKFGITAHTTKNRELGWIQKRGKKWYWNQEEDEKVSLEQLEEIVAKIKQQTKEG